MSYLEPTTISGIGKRLIKLASYDNFWCMIEETKQFSKINLIDYKLS